MNTAFDEVIASSERDRGALFAETAARLGTAVQNVEKDFWVCWTLDALFNGLDAGSPRLRFKGGTSLATNCMTHARLSFGSPDLGPATAAPGTFTLTPTPAMRDALRADYAAMSGMISGNVPTLDAVLASIGEV